MIKKKEIFSVDIFENLETRYSLRRYSEQKVEQEKLEKCLRASQLSPSACNAQPYTFVAVDDPALCAEISDALKNSVLHINTFTNKTPCFVVIVSESGNMTSKLGDILRDKNYSEYDAGIAAQSFCLCANELGLGTCIMGWFDEKKLKKALDVPEKKRIALVIACGYPAENTERPEKKRKPFEEVVRYNGYKKV